MLERFQKKFQIMPNGCWEWKATRLHGGYGQFGVASGKMKVAHRVSWELHRGPIKAVRRGENWKELV